MRCVADRLSVVVADLLLDPDPPEELENAVATAELKFHTVVTPHMAEKYSALVLSGEPKYAIAPELAMKLS